MYHGGVVRLKTPDRRLTKEATPERAEDRHWRARPEAHQYVLRRASDTMRMSMRRFTRLTNAFSKKVENHAAAVALYFMYYNFARIHQTLRTSPAQAAGVTEKLWAVEDIVNLLEETR